jgi:CPA1 family monovalent cation:H+ antiporter
VKVTTRSPSDSGQVIGILKDAKVPRSLEVEIAGESLFNDGIGVVAFIVLREVAACASKILASNHQVIG